MRTIVILAACAAACAASSAPMKVGESTFMLTGTDSWALSSENAVVERLTREAQNYCATQGMNMEVVDTSSNKHYGRPAQARVTFECVTTEAQESAEDDTDAAPGHP